MTLIDYVFRKLETAEYVFTMFLLKKTRFRSAIDSQLVKGSHTLLKFARRDFYHFF